jgi:hypothetical protein
LQTFKITPVNEVAHTIVPIHAPLVTPPECGFKFAELVFLLRQEIERDLLKAIFFVEPLLLGTLSSVPLSKGCTLLSSCRGGGASVCARGGAGGN